MGLSYGYLMLFEACRSASILEGLSRLTMGSCREQLLRARKSGPLVQLSFRKGELLHRWKLGLFPPEASHDDMNQLC